MMVNVSQPGPHRAVAPPGPVEDTVIAVMFGAGRCRHRRTGSFCRGLFQSLDRQHTVGWRGGRCLVNADYRRDVLVYELWATRRSWDAWYTSEARARVNRALEPLRETDSRLRYGRSRSPASSTSLTNPQSVSNRDALPCPDAAI